MDRGLQRQFMESQSYWYDWATGIQTELNWSWCIIYGYTIQRIPQFLKGLCFIDSYKDMEFLWWHSDRICLPMQRTQVRSLIREDSMEQLKPCVTAWSQYFRTVNCNYETVCCSMKSAWSLCLNRGPPAMRSPCTHKPGGNPCSPKLQKVGVKQWGLSAQRRVTKNKIIKNKLLAIFPCCTNMFCKSYLFYT